MRLAYISLGAIIQAILMLILKVDTLARKVFMYVRMYKFMCVHAHEYVWQLGLFTLSPSPEIG